MYLISRIAKSPISAAAAAGMWICAPFRSSETGTGMWYGLLATAPAYRSAQRALHSADRLWPMQY
jgi:hypothetical protein